MTDDELPLHVASRGDGPPIVLLHGFGASSFTWRNWVPELSKTNRVLSVDLKGHGRAPCPRHGGYAPRDLAEPVARMIARDGLEEVTLVGHSLGGGIAMLVVLLLEDMGEGHRVRGLVSVGGAAYEQPFPPFIRIARQRRLSRLVFRLLPKAWLVDRILRTIVYDGDSVTAEQVEGYADPLRRRDVRAALLEGALHMVPEDLDRWVARFPEIDVPTLLLWGREDPVVPLWVGERLARELPRARLEVLPGCGHVPQDERPEESLALLRSFLATTAAGDET